MSVYSVEQLKFSYDKRFTLFVEGFEMNEKCVGLVGPSGSGKTTLLLNLAFLLKGSGKNLNSWAKTSPRQTSNDSDVT